MDVLIKFTFMYRNVEPILNCGDGWFNYDCVVLLLTRYVHCMVSLGVCNFSHTCAIALCDMSTFKVLYIKIFVSSGAVGARLSLLSIQRDRGGSVSYRKRRYALLNKSILAMLRACCSHAGLVVCRVVMSTISVFVRAVICPAVPSYGGIILGHQPKKLDRVLV